ncbi:MAG: hypothetical protein ACLR23_08360 [Clostridia bacterium]
MGNLIQNQILTARNVLGAALSVVMMLMTCSFYLSIENRRSRASQRAWHRGRSR